MILVCQYLFSAINEELLAYRQTRCRLKDLTPIHHCLVYDRLNLVTDQSTQNITSHFFALDMFVIFVRLSDVTCIYVFKSFHIAMCMYSANTLTVRLNTLTGSSAYCYKVKQLSQFRQVIV